MIDIHTHILPGVDDGAANMDEAIEMAKIAEQDGIRHIIATPHLSDPELRQKEIESRTAEVNEALQEAGVNVTIYPGAEIPIFMLDDEDCRIGLAGSRYLLVEFPFTGMLPVSSEIFGHLTGRGYKIIIAHPERNYAVMQNPQFLLDLLSPDVTLQITAGSLTGEMGKEAMSLARYLLKKKVVAHMASDAHNVTDRRPELSAGVKAAGKYLKGRAGAGASALVNENPGRIIGG